MFYDNIQFIKTQYTGRFYLYKIFRKISFFSHILFIKMNTRYIKVNENIVKKH